MSKYQSLEHMYVATSLGQYFIFYHVVYKVNDGDAKILTVFNASIKSFSGTCFNSTLFADSKLK